MASVGSGATGAAGCASCAADATDADRRVRPTLRHSGTVAILVLAVAALLIWLYASTTAELGSEWLSSSDSSYGAILAGISFALVTDNPDLAGLCERTFGLDAAEELAELIDRTLIEGGAA